MPSTAQWGQFLFIEGFNAGYAATRDALAAALPADGQDDEAPQRLAEVVAAVPAKERLQDPHQYLLRTDFGGDGTAMQNSFAAGYVYGHRQGLRVLEALDGQWTWHRWPDRTEVYLPSESAGKLPFIGGYVAGYRQSLLAGRADPTEAGDGRPNPASGTSTQPAPEPARAAAEASGSFETLATAFRARSHRG